MKKKKSTNKIKQLDIERDKLGMPRLDQDQYKRTIDVNDEKLTVDFSDLVSTINKLTKQVQDQEITREALKELGFIECSDKSKLEYLLDEQNYLIAFKRENNKYIVKLSKLNLGLCKTIDDVKELIHVLTKYQTNGATRQ